MNNRDIEWHSKKLEQVREEIESGQLSGQCGRSEVLSEARKRLSLEVWDKLHGWMKEEIAKEGEGR